VLRAGLPREASIFPGDDSPETCHLGAFVQEHLAGVVTIYPAPFPARPEETGTWQLRGMGVLPAWQGHGLGRALVAACFEQIRARAGRLVWCNARRVALEFYRHEGFETVGEEFEIPTAGPHYRMWRQV
jgi:GNAT superfamily N-acetyltransferase